MPTLPPAMITLLAPFAPLFARRVWCHALVLVAGAILTPGRRTVCAALRALGLHQTPHWTRYHRVLNRARSGRAARSRACCSACWSPRSSPAGRWSSASTRRWSGVTRRRVPGPQIAARGIDRDAVRSSQLDFGPLC